MIAASVGVALAADGRWLGPGAEAADGRIDGEVDAALNAGVYGVGPQLGVHLVGTPIGPVSVGGSAVWVGPTATLSALGARALVLDRPGLRIAAIARGAAVTRFDGGLGLLLGGVGVAAEGQLGRWVAGGGLPVVGMELSPGHRGFRWLPGLWDARASVGLGPERRVRLDVGVATSLVLVTAGCSWQTSWGHLRVGIGGNGVANAVGGSAGISWGERPPS